jgi:hypothetical protein
MRSRQLHDALEKLTKAIHEVEAVVETMEAEHDPMASHIFVSRRHYQNLSDKKSRKRRAMSAQLSWQTACELGFRGNLAGCPERRRFATVGHLCRTLGPQLASSRISHKPLVRRCRSYLAKKCTSFANKCAEPCSLAVRT